MKASVTVTDNSKEVLTEFQRRIVIALNAVGMDAEGHAKEGCPVDTGRLRNSITYATKTNQGRSNQGGFQKKNGGLPEQAQPEDYAKKATPEDNTVYIGTNVIYAAAQEYGDSFTHTTGGAHYLKNSVANYASDYKEKIKKIMED